MKQVSCKASCLFRVLHDLFTEGLKPMGCPSTRRTCRCLRIYPRAVGVLGDFKYRGMVGDLK